MTFSCRSVAWSPNVSIPGEHNLLDPGISFLVADSASLVASHINQESNHAQIRVIQVLTSSYFIK